MFSRLNEIDKKKSSEIRKIGERIRKLKNSPLYKYRKKHGYHPVIGEGNLNTDLVFVGEAPGKNEAESGRPFCGRAGQILDDLLEQAGINRNDVYITNLVNDRPPKNRRPTKKEIRLYTPFQVKQLKVIQPEIIVTLGKTATESLLNFCEQSLNFKSFSDIVGKDFDVQFGDLNMTLIPCYHPAYAIYKRSILPTMEKIFKDSISHYYDA